MSHNCWWCSAWLLTGFIFPMTRVQSYLPFGLYTVNMRRPPDALHAFKYECLVFKSEKSAVTTNLSILSSSSCRLLWNFALTVLVWWRRAALLRRKLERCCVKDSECFKKRLDTIWTQRMYSQPKRQGLGTRIFSGNRSMIFVKDT